MDVSVNSNPSSPTSSFARYTLAQAKPFLFLALLMYDGPHELSLSYVLVSRLGAPSRSFLLACALWHHLASSWALTPGTSTTSRMAVWTDLSRLMHLYISLSVLSVVGENIIMVRVSNFMCCICTTFWYNECVSSYLLQIFSCHHHNASAYSTSGIKVVSSNTLQGRHLSW